MILLGYLVDRRGKQGVDLSLSREHLLQSDVNECPSKPKWADLDGLN